MNIYGYICQFQAHLYYPNFLNRYSKSAGDTAVVRVVMDENINYPMFGKDYFKRPQYSADMIHEEAMKWLDKTGWQATFLWYFYLYASSCRAGAARRFYSDRLSKEVFLKIKLGVDRKDQDIIRRYTPMRSLPA